MRWLTLLMLFSCVTVHAEDVALQASSSVASSATSAVSNPQFHIREVDDAWRARLPINADAATQAYLDRLPAEVVKRSNNYFEGGYWLQLWNFLLGLAISVILLSGKRSARLRDWAQRVAGKSFFRDVLFGAVYAVVSWVLSLPLTIYEGFVREHAYGMATQNFGAWFVEQLTSLGVTTLLFAIAIGVLYLVLRRTGERWWLWGTIAVTGLLTLAALIQPIFIDPLFNTYKPLKEGEVKTALMQMIKADGVPADNVYWFDASRQTTQVSANVSGIFGSASVRLNDNLLRTSLPEIRAVAGHEIGHYVLHHIYISIMESFILTLAGFLIAKWAMDRLLVRYASRYDLLGVQDVATLPLLLAVFSVLSLLATPISNTLTRVEEIEADMFGLNLSREPLGEAEVDLKLTEYRKPDPGPVEEFIFFDHPSTRYRIHAAMQWREHMLQSK